MIFKGKTEMLFDLSKSNTWEGEIQSDQTFPVTGSPATDPPFCLRSNLDNEKMSLNLEAKKQNKTQTTPRIFSTDSLRMLFILLR